MQVGNFPGQYNKAGLTQQAPVANVSSTNVTNLTSTLRDLVAGSVFEGNVVMVKGSKVLLSLDNGQNIQARLDGSLKLLQGQSMFFQVKANDGAVLSIKPFMGEGLANPTLLKALEAAGLPKDERSLQMVDAMMKEQMSIDVDSLTAMHRVLVSNETINVSTLVQMTKLDMPVTPQLAAQFENYQNDSHMLLTQMKDLMNELPAFLESQNLDIPKLLDVNASLIDILTEGLPDQEVQMPEIVPENLLEQATEMSPLTAGQQSEAAFESELPPLDQGEDLAESVEQQFRAQLSASEPMQENNEYAPNQLGAFLSSDEQEDFAIVLRSIGDLADRPEIFDQNVNLNEKLTAEQLLAFINEELFVSKQELEMDDVKDLFSNKGYQKLLESVMEEQWLLGPEDVKSKDKVSDLYAKLERQMGQIEKVLKATGNTDSLLSQTTQQIRGNMEFMHEVNQIYNYIQLPLKFENQNANGDLYVYTNKKKPRDPDGELSAFLHLDMEHLGSTDVIVKMKNKAVSTDFTFDNDTSFALVQKYLPILEEKLRAKGYSCNATVKCGNEKLDFVEDFLKRDAPSMGAVVHRYSFDVRA